MFTYWFLIFWPLYLGVTDLRRNKGQQKSVIGRLRRSIRTRDLKQPVQKKLVKWQRRSLIPFVGFFYMNRVRRLAEGSGRTDGADRSRPGRRYGKCAVFAGGQ